MTVPRPTTVRTWCHGMPAAQVVHAHPEDAHPRSPRHSTHPVVPNSLAEAATIDAALRVGLGHQQNELSGWLAAITRSPRRSPGLLVMPVTLRFPRT